MSVCKSNLTIKCDTSNILHELLESFYSYTNEQFEIKDISGNILKCVFVTSWYPDFEQELLEFDRGKHDDQVDMMSLFGMYLDKMMTAPNHRQIADL